MKYFVRMAGFFAVLGIVLVGVNVVRAENAAVYSKVSPVSSLSSDVDTQESQTVCLDLQNNLRYRSRDAGTNGEVSYLQDFLQAHGYLNSEPTGFFGLLTLKAVQSFQQGNGISPTGFVGSLTRAKIKSMSCVFGSDVPTGYSAPIVPSSFTTPTSAPVGSFWVDIQANGGKNGPITIPYGTAEMLIWTSQGASYCYLTPGKNTDMEKGLSGNGAFNTPNLFTDTTYVITCLNTIGKSTSDSITIRVSNTPLTVNLKADESDGPITIPYGTASMLSWTSTGAIGCYMKPGKNADVDKYLPASGGLNTPNLTTTTTYVVTCYNYANEEVSDGVIITVVKQPLSVDIQADNSNGPIAVSPGTAAVLTWSAPGATGCVASRQGSGNWSGPKNISGAEGTGNLTVNTTFTITCQYFGGQQASDSVVVNIKG